MVLILLASINGALRSFANAYLAYLTAGLVQTIMALAAMTEAFEDDVKNGLRKESHR